jgi:glycerophosphoryl diester phosphodiesterase
MQKPLIIAHRGASALAPENTLAAFGKAIEDGAEGIEFDIQLSKDSVPMVFHDEDLKRIAGQDILVSKLTSDELQKINAGSWFNQTEPEKAQEHFANEIISTLEQTLGFLTNYKGLIYIELKCEAEGNAKVFSKSVGDVIKNSHLLPQMIVKSFNLDILPLIKEHCSNVKTAALFSPTVMILLRKERRLINIAEDLKVDGLSLHFSLATNKLMRRAKKRNLKVAIWTADNPRWVNRGLKVGIDHIITNNPARLLEKRHRILQKTSILA